MDTKQQIIADELVGRLIELVKGDIFELEENGKLKDAASELNSQPLLKRYMDFSVVYAWIISFSCAMYYSLSERKMICDAVFDKVRKFLDESARKVSDLRDYIKSEEELSYLSDLFSRARIMDIKVSSLWDAVIEKRFFDYNNAYPGSFASYPLAVKLYRHIFGREPRNEMNALVLVSHFSGLLSIMFAFRADDPSQQEILKFTKMIEINPSYGKAYYSRALVYFAKKEYRNSWKDVSRAKELGYEIEPEFFEKLKKALEGK